VPKNIILGTLRPAPLVYEAGTGLESGYR